VVCGWDEVDGCGLNTGIGVDYYCNLQHTKPTPGSPATGGRPASRPVAVDGVDAVFSYTALPRRR